MNFIHKFFIYVMLAATAAGVVASIPSDRNPVYVNQHIYGGNTMSSYDAAAYKPTTPSWNTVGNAIYNTAANLTGASLISQAITGERIDSSGITRYLSPDQRLGSAALGAFQFGTALSSIYNIGRTAGTTMPANSFNYSAMNTVRPASVFSRSGEVANQIPTTLARVIPNGTPLQTLGRAGNADVFVTAADDIAGMNAKQIAARLGIAESSTGYYVIKFPTPSSGIASPIFRNNKGFIGGGITSGGAREFVIPNQPIPQGATIRIVL